MNKQTHFFMKICISHTLFSMFLWCMRDERRQRQTAILTQILLWTIAALLPHLGRGSSTGGCWGPQPSVCKLALTLAFPSPTNSILTQIPLLTIAALLPHLGRGSSTGGCWGPQPSVCKLALTLAFPSPTNSTAAGICLYSFITPTCFRFFFHLFTQVHLWLTAWSRVNIQHNNTI